MIKLTKTPIEVDSSGVLANSPDTADPDITRLYDFIYNNLSDVKKALSQIELPGDPPDASKARIQLLTTVTSYIGSAAKTQTAASSETHSIQISSSVGIDDYKKFMEKWRGRNIEKFVAAGIFYVAGVSKVFSRVLTSDNRPIDRYYVTLYGDLTFLRLMLNCSLTTCVM
jgi:hypothetical protein